MFNKNTCILFWLWCFSSGSLVVDTTVRYPGRGAQPTVVRTTAARPPTTTLDNTTETAAAPTTGVDTADVQLLLKREEGTQCLIQLGCRSYTYGALQFLKLIYKVIYFRLQVKHWET